MLNQRIYNPLIVLAVFAIAAVLQLKPRQQTSVGGRHPAVERYRFRSIGEQMDARVHDAFFRIRNEWFTQPVSDDVTVIGIDDYTVSELGKFNTGPWLTRQPFQTQLQYFGTVFQPSVIAYDIIFKKIDGSGKQSLLSEDGTRIGEVIKALDQLAKDGRAIEDNDVLASMALITKEQGDLNLANSLASAFRPDASPEERITTILAFYFPETSQDSWPTASILGDDAEDLDEDWGTEMPFLRDVRIPPEFVTGSEDYPWFEYAAILPTNVYLDYGRLGYINVPRDEDGIIRRLPLVIGMRYEFTDPETGKPVERKLFLPSMSLLSCMAFWGIDLTALHLDEAFVQDGKPVIEVDLGDEIRIRRPDGTVERIPIDERGRMVLDYVGQVRDFTNVSFASVTQFPMAAFDRNLHEGEHPELDKLIAERADVIQRIRESLNRKLVMLGLMATGEIDVGPCPINSNTPFVHVHMTAASNILTRTYLRASTTALQGWILAATGLIMMLGSAYLRPLKLGYLVVFLMVAYGATAFFGVVGHWRQLPVIVPVGGVLAAFLLLVLVHYLTEARERIRIRGMFSTMVSGDVLDYMEANPDSFSLGGERRDATIFFSDLAGFTTISENLPADKLVDLLNEYLSPMTEIIMESQGFVDKYIGDAIMAVWGVPYPNPDHARLACFAALDQQAKINELGARFKEEYGVDVLVRMGINSGTIVAGNMGSAARLSYTVMGDAVNQAARYEPANKDYDTLIMIGESTFQLAKEHVEARLLDRVVVKGKSVPIQVYELLAKKGELEESKAKVVSLYHQALEVHWTRQWDRAIELLDDALTLDPDDGPSQAMRERIEAYRDKPPPDSWQGEFVRTKK